MYIQAKHGSPLNLTARDLRGALHRDENNPSSANFPGPLTPPANLPKTVSDVFEQSEQSHVAKNDRKYAWAPVSEVNKQHACR